MSNINDASKVNGTDSTIRVTALWTRFLDLAEVPYQRLDSEFWLPNQNVLLQVMPRMDFPGDANVNRRAELLAKSLEIYCDVIYGVPGKARPSAQSYFVIGYKGAGFKGACVSSAPRSKRGMRGGGVSIGICGRHKAIVFSAWDGATVIENHGCRPDSDAACAGPHGWDATKLADQYMALVYR